MLLEKCYFDINDDKCQYLLNKRMYKLIKNCNKKYEKIAVFCMGTDRSTGDSYGPFVGFMLSDFTLCKFDLYGTLYEPIHAENFKENIDKINKENTLIIAIDAALGDSNHVGFIEVNYGSIKPGSGVKKDFGEVGDIYITGIVNCLGIFPFLILQNTQLKTVYRMAEITANALRYALIQTNK